ncbi:hypothetical protein [Comamonas sp. HJ-2]
MLYTPENARGASVFDVDAKEEIRKVLEVSTSQGWVKVHRHTLDTDSRGRFLSDKIRFRSIYAIRGDEAAPCLFHCYGRLP